MLSVGLTLAETLVKNCHDPVHREMSSERFMAAVAKIARVIDECGGEGGREGGRETDISRVFRFFFPLPALYALVPLRIVAYVKVVCCSWRMTVVMVIVLLMMNRRGLSPVSTAAFLYH